MNSHFSKDGSQKNYSTSPKRDFEESLLVRSAHSCYSIVIFLEVVQRVMEILNRYDCFERIGKDVLR